MPKFTDQKYLKSEQYKDSSNLEARIAMHQRFSTNPYGWHRWVFDNLLKLPEGANILELGCGPGYLWKENMRRIPAGWHITLSDLSSGMLDVAWRNLVVIGRAFQFKEIDAQSIPLEDKTFDAVIANHMLYHVPDRTKALSEIKRVLKPDGHLFATTVGETHMKKMMSWYAQVHESKIREPFANPFTLENGIEQLKLYFPQVKISRYEDGLEITEIEPIKAYLRSGMRVSELSEEELSKLQQELEEELMQNGRIFVAKDSGLFEVVT